MRNAMPPSATGCYVLMMLVITIVSVIMLSCQSDEYSAEIQSTWERAYQKGYDAGRLDYHLDLINETRNQENPNAESE